MAWSVRSVSSTTCPLAVASLEIQYFNSTSRPGSFTRISRICSGDAATRLEFSFSSSNVSDFEEAGAESGLDRRLTADWAFNPAQQNSNAKAIGNAPAMRRSNSLRFPMAVLTQHSFQSCLNCGPHSEFRRVKIRCRWNEYRRRPNNKWCDPCATPPPECVPRDIRAAPGRRSGDALRSRPERRRGDPAGSHELAVGFLLPRRLRPQSQCPADRQVLPQALPALIAAYWPPESASFSPWLCPRKPSIGCEPS